MPPRAMYRLSLNEQRPLQSHRALFRGWHAKPFEHEPASAEIFGQMRSIREALFGQRPTWLMPTTRWVAEETTGAPSAPSVVSQRKPISFVGDRRFKSIGSTAHRPPTSRSD